MDFYNEYDHSDMRNNLLSWPEQFRRSWDLGFSIGKKQSLDAPQKMLWIGMGGSAIGGDFTSAMTYNRSSFPLIVHRGGAFPRWVDKNTRVLLVSFSGNTAETLASAEEADERGCMIDAITSGGKLKDWAIKRGVEPWPVPGGRPPRAALGDLFTTALAVFAGRKWCHVDDHEVNETNNSIELNTELCSREPDEKHILFDLLELTQERYPMVYGTGRFSAVARRWAGQINENAKRPAHWGELPEMNHNEVVAYDARTGLGEKNAVIILVDPDSPQDILDRVDVTLELASDAGFESVKVIPESQTRLARMLELTVLGDWLSYYMAISKKIDPTPIPTIDKLKDVLAQK